MGKKQTLKRGMLVGGALLVAAVLLSGAGGKKVQAHHLEGHGSGLSQSQVLICIARQKVVTDIMTRAADRTQKQLDLFTTIAGRTQKFYTDKGKTLATYDALAADLKAKQTTAQAAVSTVVSSGKTLDCEGSDPKDTVEYFNTDLNNGIAALKAYKTSLKNLIAGVKSAQGATTSSYEHGSMQ